MVVREVRKCSAFNTESTAQPITDYHAYRKYTEWPAPYSRPAAVVLYISILLMIVAIEKPHQNEAEYIIIIQLSVILKFPIGLNENLREEAVPNVSFVRRFYCRRVDWTIPYVIISVVQNLT